MSKRFIDTEIWDKDKFCSSTEKQKLLTLFITTKCDQVGVFKMANMLTSAYIGSTVTEDDILSIPVDIEKIGDNKYWLLNFCKFQYGELKESCKPHKKYIEMLKSESLFERVSKGYTKGIHTLQEKEKEKEEEKEEEKEKEKETKIKTKIFVAPTVEEVKEYCIERRNNVDPNHFLDYYFTRGWILGNGRKVKCWKACLRTWEKNNFSTQSSQPIKKENFDPLEGLTWS